jgi:hypothetical protein
MVDCTVCQSKRLCWGESPPAKHEDCSRFTPEVKEMTEQAKEAEAWKIYLAAETQARAEAEKACGKDIDVAWKAYAKVIVTAWETYQKAIAK